jgi:hypothetical protein
VFPKRLPADEGKVIGIKYDLVEPGEPTDAISADELKRAAKVKRAKPREAKTEPKKAEPVVKTFQVAVRRVAVMEMSLAIDARSKAEARRKAAGTLKAGGFDSGKAKIQDKIISVE